MNMKPLTKPKELGIYRLLNCRMELSEKEIQHLSNLEKGYAGEVLFSQYLEPLAENNTILFDLLFEQNQTVFQIDAVLLMSDQIYLFEVKNYYGDFFLDGDVLRTISGNEVKSPILQVKRSESLMRRMFSEMGISSKLQYYIVFTNPEFTLYGAPASLKAIFPTQIKRFIGNLLAKPAQITTQQEKLAMKLLDRHLVDSPYTRIPEYEFGELRKGVVCRGCGSFDTEVLSRKKLLCRNCGKTEIPEVAILRSIDDYRLLFPSGQITTNIIYDWSDGKYSKKMLWNLLSKKFNKKGSGVSTFYEKF